MYLPRDLHALLDERPKIVASHPDMKFTDMGHLMGERWRALPAEEKKRYEDLANDDKKRFNEEMAAYNASKPPPEVSQEAAYDAPHPQYQEAQQYAEEYYRQQVRSLS